jgi:HlyD family secretion protein
VDSARIQLQAALDAAREQERAYRTVNWTLGAPEGFTLPMWYFNSDERRAALEAELAKAQADLEHAKRDLADVERQAGSQEFLTAEKNLAQALEAYQVAAEVLDRASRSSNGAELVEEAQREYDRAKADLEAAQDAYDRALLTDSGQNVLRARARVEVEQERCDTIQDHLRMLETGEDSPQVAAARNILAQAQAAADQAQAALRGARANLALIDAEIAKAVITAPVDGVVLTRMAEPGSVIAAGSIVFTLGQLDRLTITVYVPESRLGEVTLGMSATVNVDSFPDETFLAKVTYISDVAEFTPRNVQTVEGRKATVFAVKLSVTNGGEKLKPGMPADVTFE